MIPLLKIAWRDIWRNKRRTFLTIAAVFFALFLSVVMKGLSDGIWEYSVRTSVEMFSGYLQVQHDSYNDNPSLDKRVPYDEELRNIIRQIPSISAFTPRILGDGLISYDNNALGTMIIGINPHTEQKISSFHRRVQDGMFLDEETRGEIVIGETLMRNLNASVGDFVVILAQDRFGVMGNMRYRIAGSVGLGMPDFDRTVVIMHLEDLQDLLLLHGDVSIYVLNVKDIRRIERISKRLDQMLIDAGYESLTVLTWEEVLPELKQAMDFDRIGDNLFLAILIIIVAFGILNTILMSVTERFREFGVNLALGMPQIKLVGLILVESLMITLIGIIAGNLAGYGVVSYFKNNPIELGGDYAELYELYGIEPLIVTSTNPVVFLSVSGFVLIIALLASLYPAYKVYKLEPLKGIRYT